MSITWPTCSCCLSTACSFARRGWRATFRAVRPRSGGLLNAFTRHIDAIVRERIAAGLDQLVLLGARVDSRAMRFDCAARPGAGRSAPQ
jgi:O-methyltransferase involved in polyketide biosynthesis